MEPAGAGGPYLCWLLGHHWLWTSGFLSCDCFSRVGSSWSRMSEPSLEHMDDISEANPKPVFALLLKYSSRKLCKDYQRSLENNSQSPKLLCSTDLLHAPLLSQTQDKCWVRNSVCWSRWNDNFSAQIYLLNGYTEDSQTWLWNILSQDGVLVIIVYPRFFTARLIML